MQRSQESTALAQQRAGSGGASGGGLDASMSTFDATASPTCQAPPTDTRALPPDQEQHTPLPSEPGGPSTPTQQRAPARLLRGRRIAIAVDHDGSAHRAVHYASKLLIKSPEDKVEIVHVQQRDRPCNGAASPATTYARPASAGAPAEAMQRGESEPWAELAPTGGGGGGAGPKRDWLSRLSLQAMPWQHRTGGSSGRRGARSASPAGRSSQPESDEEEGGCRELLERCRQQLLASNRRVPPERVAVRLLPAGKIPEKAIAKLCKEGCGADILVLGSPEPGSVGGHAGGSSHCSEGSGSTSHGHGHGPMHGVPGVGKLLSMMSAAEGVTAYCREHLRGTRVVCAGTKHK